MHVCWHARARVLLMVAVGTFSWVGWLWWRAVHAYIHILLVSECKLGNCPGRGHKTVSFKP